MPALAYTDTKFGDTLGRAEESSGLLPLPSITLAMDTMVHGCRIHAQNVHVQRVPLTAA